MAEKEAKLPENYKDALKEVKKLRAQIEKLKQKYNDEESEEEEEEKHDQEFWDNIKTKIRSDPDYIKGLLRDNELDVEDEDDEGKSLLILAATEGNYALCQLCLNLGADVNKIDNDGYAAISYANDGSYFHVEQLLLFASMDAAVSTEVNDFAKTINKQQGLIDAFMKQLAVKKNKKIVQDTIIDIMINLVNSKLSFSDDMLNLAWRCVAANNESNILSSNLWKCIKKTAKDIIVAKPKNERDWYWLKEHLLSSTIWLVDLDPSQPVNEESDEEEEEEEEAEEEDEKKMKDEKKVKRRKYLFYELLKVVSEKADAQLHELVAPMKQLSDESPDDWKELCEWNIETSLENSETGVRQDAIDNGTFPQFTKEELSAKVTSSTSFNALKHYDYNEYLSKLVLNAHIVDDGFHKSVREIFSINKETGMYHDEKTGDTIRYMRGPVKLIERCKAKAEVEYRNEKWPTSSHVLDINRCALIFDKISVMLTALKLLQNKIKYYQSGTIIDIVRDKNGFFEYIKTPQYADIKLNITIRGPEQSDTSIIGEIQFLLQVMMDFKHKAHGLYSITRRSELFDGIGNILPNLLDLKKKTFVSGSLGDMKSIFDLMVTNNKTEKEILTTDNEAGESIIFNMCLCGELKAFRKLKSYYYTNNNLKSLFIKCIFTPNSANVLLMSLLVADADIQMLQYILSIKEVINEILSNDYYVFRLLFAAFSCEKDQNFNYVMSTLESNDISGNIIKQKYFYNPKDSSNLLAAAAISKKANQVKFLYDLTNKDDDLFIKSFNGCNNFNQNVIDLTAVAEIEMIKFYHNNKKLKSAILKDDNLVFRLLMNLVQHYDKKAYDFIMNEFLKMDKVKWKKYLYYYKKYDAKRDNKLWSNEKKQDDNKSDDEEEDETADIESYSDRTLLYNALVIGNEDIANILIDVLLKKNGEQELMKFVTIKDRKGKNAFVATLESECWNAQEICNNIFEQIEKKKNKKLLLKTCEGIENEELEEKIQEWKDSI